TRKTHPTDKRGKIIVLTERGLSVLKAKENIGAERMQMLKEDLTTFVTKENTGKLSSNIRPVW
ncbi:MarR family transcriptional regulator, partial [Klebsiella pneumoniae]|nr:MarR family transcriptional regulator [Klebsiella pneumoniae]